MAFIAYNVVWWVPVILTVIGLLSYWAGAVSFLAISVARAAINLYRTNVMSIDAAQRFPLRSP